MSNAEREEANVANTDRAENAASAIDLEGATTLRATQSAADDKAIRRTRTIATIILIILIIIILAACLMMFSLLRPGGLTPGAQHAGITWIRSIYGHGNAADDLINPSSVYFDPDGNSLWITDSVRHRIVQYDVNGRLIQIKYADFEEMIFPTRIAVSPQGWFYIAEQTYDRIQIFNEDFDLQESILIENPTAVAANDDYLVVGSRRGFAVFTYDGGHVGTPDFEDEINHFDYISGLALDDDNNIFVLDSFNNRFLKYSIEGEVLYEIFLGHPGNEGIAGGRNVPQGELEEEYPANMQLPQGLTLDGNGRVYIIDMFDFSVAVFEADTGSFIKKVGAQGFGDGTFHNPNCIVYNPQMDMFASAEAQIGRVQIFAIEGSSGDTLIELRRQFDDFLRACCWPLIIILIIIAAYLISRWLSRRRRDKELTAALADPNDTTSEGAANTVGDNSQE